VTIRVDHERAGVILLTDELRVDTPRALRALRSVGVDRVVMVSGDRLDVAEPIGRSIGVDAVLVRIAALVLIFAGGAGLILYVIGWLAMPEPPEDAARVRATGPSVTRADEPTTGAVVLGAILVLIGAFFLLDEAFPDFLSWNWIWPIVLILVGAVVILRARR